MKKKDRPESPATFIDEPQVDEIQPPVADKHTSPPEPPDEPPDEPPAEKKWIVGPNAISGTLRGILASGTPVKSRYFKHGDVTMNQLISDGAIVEAKE